jgi:lipopolysaccharide biosynthesis glycosyltransferase
METSKDNAIIKILVATHKPEFVPDNDLLVPIRLGASLTDDKFDCVGDNTGDHISEKNRSYCELTALYWAWKNLEADYIGLFHYRRYLSFAPNQDSSHDKAFDTIYDGLKHINLDEAVMRDTIKKYDVVVPKLGFADGTLREQFRKEHNISDLDDCLSYIAQKYPKVAEFNKTLDQKSGYFYNMSIMRRDIFDKYCEFLFDVLGNFDRTHDITDYDIQQYRVDGFLAERLTNIYIHYLKSQKSLKIKELQVAYFKNTAQKTEVKPIAKNNNIAIVLAANDFYIPYVSTLLGSIAKHSLEEYVYDINIFTRDISSTNQTILQEEFTKYRNFHIRFVDMNPYVSMFNQIVSHIEHISIETYFRIFIPDIMPEYKKVLYLDGDMIATTDVAKLFNENVGSYLLAAVRDYDMAGVYNSNNMAATNTIDPDRKNYVDNVLKLKNPYNYFQAGAILFNLDEMRRSINTDEVMKYAASRRFEYMDQDVLNHFAEGKVKFLDPSWNVLYDWNHWRIANVISKAPHQMYTDYMQSRRAPKIIHYGGSRKPWHYPEEDFGELYWEIAKNSVYYGTIISRMIQQQISNPVKQSKGNIKSRTMDRIKKKINEHFPHNTPGRERIHKAKVMVKKIIHK